MTNSPEFTIVNNLTAGRFELEKEGFLSVLEYELVEGKIYFTHTGVPEQLEGQGIASRLAVAGLDYARANNLVVVPACSFIVKYLDRHPEYQDLVADQDELE